MQRCETLVAATPAEHGPDEAASDDRSRSAYTGGASTEAVEEIGGAVGKQAGGASIGAVGVGGAGSAARPTLVLQPSETLARIEDLLAHHRLFLMREPPEDTPWGCCSEAGRAAVARCPVRAVRE